MSTQQESTASLVLFITSVVVLSAFVATNVLGLGPESEPVVEPTVDVAQSPDTDSNGDTQVTVAVTQFGDAKRIYVNVINSNDLISDSDGVGGPVGEDGRRVVGKLEPGDTIEVVAVYPNGNEYVVKSYTVEEAGN